MGESAEPGGGGGGGSKMISFINYTCLHVHYDQHVLSKKDAGSYTEISIPGSQNQHHSTH